MEILYENWLDDGVKTPYHVFSLNTMEPSSTTKPTPKTAPAVPFVLDNVTISLQDLGSVIAVFLQGSKEDIEARYNSLWNHQATGGELESWTENFGYILIWGNAKQTALEKLAQALTFAELSRMLNEGGTKGSNPIDKAYETALAQIDKMEWVRWIYTSARDVEIYGFGDSVAAEKGTGNFDDDVIAEGLKRPGSNPDMKVEEELEEEVAA